MSEKSDRNGEQLTAPDKFLYKVVISTVVPATIVVDVWASCLERAEVTAKAAARREIRYASGEQCPYARVQIDYSAPGPLEVVGTRGGGPSYEKLSEVPTVPEGS